MTYVYFIEEVRSKGGGPVKIGVAKDPNKRLKNMQVGNASHLQLITSIGPIERKQAFRIERALHKYFQGLRIDGEWFNGKVRNRLKALADGNIDSFLDMARVRRKSKHRRENLRRFMDQ